MSARTVGSLKRFKLGWVAVIAVYLAFAAVFTRTLATAGLRPILPRYLSLELVYILLFTLVLWKSELPGWMLHLYLVLQSILVLTMLSLRPQFDFVVILFLLLTFQVSLYLTGWVRWSWVGLLILLTGGSLIYHLGLLKGLALSLTTIAAEIILPAYTISAQEIKKAQQKSQELLGELRETHQQLELYANQVEELASMQERNRLVRELHDSVSQLIFSISLTTRSAQLLLDKDPEPLPEIVKRLQDMTTEALRQLRSFISQLRPPQET
jgi:signal transduction histidine kinase